jgi:uncharacterized protein (UPF0264 family)
MPAKILISVRTAAEAAEALAAGADLIDVKEPIRGALGRSDSATIQQVLAEVAGRVPTSVALGELLEAEELPQWDGFRPGYVKFGLAGAGRMPDWPARLRRAISDLPPGVLPVAVAYADWRQADSPLPAEVLSVAVGLGCRGLLLDTFHKSNGSLLSQLPLSELERLLEAARASNLITVLAGGLQVHDLERLLPLSPDYFGFRGAVCRAGRESELDPLLVADLRRQIHQVRLDQTSLAQGDMLNAR